jgi:hypothetical protein
LNDISTAPVLKNKDSNFHCDDGPWFRNLKSRCYLVYFAEIQGGLIGRIAQWMIVCLFTLWKLLENYGSIPHIWATLFHGYIS